MGNRSEEVVSDLDIVFFHLFEFGDVHHDHNELVATLDAFDFDLNVLLRFSHFESDEVRPLPKTNHFLDVIPN